MNIYIGNLTSDVSDQELRDLFQKYGEVESAKVIKDRMTGESRGFGFVEMKVKAEAQTAMEELDGSELSGRHIIVNEARPRTQGRRNKGRGGGGRWRY